MISLSAHQLFQQNMQEHLNKLHNSNAPTNTTANAIAPPPTTTTTSSLYQGLPNAINNDSNAIHNSGDFSLTTSPLALSTKLGLQLPNPAPDVTPIIETEPIAQKPLLSTAQKLAVANANGLLLRFDLLFLLERLIDCLFCSLYIFSSPL